MDYSVILFYIKLSPAASRMRQGDPWLYRITKTRRTTDAAAVVGYYFMSRPPRKRGKQGSLTRQ